MSMASWTSPRVSARTLPISRVMSFENSSLRCSSSSAARNKTSARFGAGTSRHALYASFAAATATSTSSCVEDTNIPINSPVFAGLRFSYALPLRDSTHSPLMKFLNSRGATAVAILPPRSLKLATLHFVWSNAGSNAKHSQVESKFYSRLRIRSNAVPLSCMSGLSKARSTRSDVLGLRSPLGQRNHLLSASVAEQILSVLCVVHHHRPALHHPLHVLQNNIDISQRVPLDSDHIREISRSYCSHLFFFPQQLRRISRRGAQRLLRRHSCFHEPAQLASVLPKHRVDGIRTHRKLHAGFERLLRRFQIPWNERLQLLLVSHRVPDLVAVFDVIAVVVDRWHIERSTLYHFLDRGIVHVRRML